MWEILFLLLPLAAFSGFVMGRRAFSSHRLLERILGLSALFSQKNKPNTDVLIRWLDNNQETVETHLSLANLFRRQGEVDKAVGIHQNLITKQNLTQEQRALSLLELSRDYMRAGVLDRAENVLLEMAKEGLQLEAVYKHLIEIYQQSKDWLRAIEIAQKWQEHSHQNLGPQIAHYHCEIAEQRWLQGDTIEARQHLRFAREENHDCVRASILLGNIEVNSGNFKAAIKAYQHVERQDPAFLSEIVFPLARCYEGLNNIEGMVKYLTACLQTHPTVSVVLAFSDWLNKTQGEAEAVKFVVEHLRVHPSVRGLNRLVQFNISRAEGSTKADLQVLQELIEKLVANKPLYRCQACGYSGRNLQWQCPGCKRWDVMKPIHE